MTTKELNRDIKRLSKIERYIDGNINPVFESEYLRLYGADKEFAYMNLTSVKIMLRLNVCHRLVPFHRFGLHIGLHEFDMA